MKRKVKLHPDELFLDHQIQYNLEWRRIDKIWKGVDNLMIIRKIKA